MTRALAEHLAALALVDNHAHGCWLGPGDRRRFENALIEADTDPLADSVSGFDTQLGMAVRAHCAPLLGLDRHAAPDAYWARRASLSESDLAQLFLRSAGVGDWLIDTGLSGDSDRVAGVPELAGVAAGRVHEVVRLEQIAAQAAAAVRDNADAGDYADVFAEILCRRAESAVATKTVLAYRGGFEGDLSRPPPREVAAAARRWCDEGAPRLTDRVLLRFGIHEALALGKPLQFHVGLGDRDCDLHRTNPIHLLDFLRDSGGVPIVLLHCYPYEREAGYLAQAFGNVYLDVGLSINHLGARAAAFIARTLELAPFGKILYSSDGYGPPELHYLGARLWRDGMTAVLGGFVDRDEWSEADARRVADLIGRDNANRVYRLTG